MRVRNTLCGLLALAVACVALSENLLMPRVAGVTPKLQRLDQNGSGITTLFIGTSLVQRQIDPRLFDRIVRANGRKQNRSFNLGVDGLFLLEMEYLLARATQGKLPRLQFVFVEAVNLSAQLPKRGAETTRDLYWRDWRATGTILTTLSSALFVHDDTQTAAADPQGAVNGGKRLLNAMGRTIWKAVPCSEYRMEIGVLKEMWGHVALMGRKYANLGRGLEFGEVVETNPGVARLRAEQKWSETGFFAVDHAISASEAEELQQWAQSKPPLENQGWDANAKVLQRIGGRLRSRGVTTILLVPPLPGVSRVYRPIAAATGLPLLAFDDPAEFPVLYQPENHYDMRHLNKKGAREFTSLLAAEFLRSDAAQGGQ